MKNFLFSTVFLFCTVLASAGTMTDPRDGRTYRTTVLAGKVWLAENLKYAMTDSYCPENSEAECEANGRLYTFAAAQKACPAGWYLPSENEAKTMIWNAFNMRKYMDAKAVGFRKDDGSFLFAGVYGYFWSSSTTKQKPRYWYVSEKDFDVKWLPGQPTSALSVRCIQKGNAPVSLETMEDSRDGLKYRTVKIGEQKWIAENVKNHVEGSICFENKDVNCEKGGRLYTLSQAKKACPTGWRLPNEEDFQTMLSAATERICVEDCWQGELKKGKCSTGSTYSRCFWKNAPKSLGRIGFPVNESGIKNVFGEGPDRVEAFKKGAAYWTYSDEDHSVYMVFTPEESNTYWEGDGQHYFTNSGTNFYSVRCVKDPVIRRE